MAGSWKLSLPEGTEKVSVWLFINLFHSLSRQLESMSLHMHLCPNSVIVEMMLIVHYYKCIQELRLPTQFLSLHC